MEIKQFWLIIAPNDFRIEVPYGRVVIQDNGNSIIYMEGTDKISAVVPPTHLIVLNPIILP
ncbi:hypothetical protein M2132_001021 [Dysgonomonas sp. PH5-45]|uniref:hypothetical protein n=1 Tax=Dysgonomonas sp. PH5-45 TaxID=1742396 RepID=UPI00247488E9|nr:hypothetical protein [Dysgonomonas sp. PH5-45]MDH6354692.1 hypothetical protein [Dysgonomonas sp. PH5-45]MDH6387590.1 hypothetical protein [Dysgonomonas sp. PH5-37]